MTKITVVDVKELPKIVEMTLKSTDYIRIGKAMTDKIVNQKFCISQTSRTSFCSEANCSLNQYYAVLNILKEIGFIKKEGGKYVLDMQFTGRILNEWFESLGYTMQVVRPSLA